MKLKLLAGCALACLLSACAGLPVAGVGGGGSAWSSAAIEIAKDPACGHTDVLDVMLGPIPSGHVHLERDCPKPAVPPGDPSQVPIR